MAKKTILLLSKYASIFSGFLIFLIMIGTVIDIAGRTITKFIYVKGIHEITQLLLVILVYFALGAAESNNDHVEIDFLYDISISKLPNRVQRVFCYLRSLIYLAATALMVWRVMEYGKYMMTTNAYTSSLHVPIYPLILFSTLGLLLYPLVVLVKAIDSIKDGRL